MERVRTRLGREPDEALVDVAELPAWLETHNG